MNLNKVFLIGRLTRDPETRTTPSGQMVATFGLATSRIWNNRETQERQEATEYHNIVLWRRLAEIASQYLKKGSLVLIEGRIQNRSWQDQAGNKRYRTEIVGENIQMGPRSSSQPDKELKKTVSQEEIPVIEENTPPAALAPEENDEQEIDIKDIPF